MLKIHQFLLSIKKDADKRKLVPFSALRCTFRVVYDSREM